MARNKPPKPRSCRVVIVSPAKLMPVSGIIWFSRLGLVWLGGLLPLCAPTLRAMQASLKLPPVLFASAPGVGTVFFAGGDSGLRDTISGSH